MPNYFQLQDQYTSRKPLSYEYIRGLVEGEGTFTFSTSHKLRRRVPAFSIKMHWRDEDLLEMVRDTMRLSNRIYVYNHQSKDGHKRAPQAMLIVREIGQLKNIIVPFFYRKLRGNKAKQFENWLEKIGQDPHVPESYRFIHKLYKLGWYDRPENKKF